MSFPHRLQNNHPRCDFRKFNSLTFDEPDYRTFRNLSLAIEALNKGGNLPCVLNAANEIAVYAFLRNRLGFLDMTDVIERTMEKVSFIQQPSMEEYLESDGEARTYAAEMIKL
jgi:1-deoxy-D-xylulose-5-phosphate reductoisomerase